jgi:ribonuclease-3
VSTSGGTVATLAAQLGLSAESPVLLTALTHGSFANDHQVASNEQLEFLGDAVVDLAATTLLLDAYPDLTEGQGSQARQWLVSEAALVRASGAFALSDALRVGKSVLREGQLRPSIVADAFEAMVAAVFIEQGYDAAAAIVHHALRPLLEHAVQEASSADPKSRLAQWAHQQGLGAPSYHVTTEGTAHEPSFVAEVRIDGRVRATARDSSKRRAELAAARGAWEGRNDA